MPRRSSGTTSKALDHAEKLIADAFDVHRVPIEVVAVVIGMSDRQVRNLVKAGTLPAPLREGRSPVFDLPTAVAAFVEYVASDRETGNADAKTRWWAARADKEELAVETAAARLIPLEAAEVLTAEVFTLLANETDGVAGRLASEIAGCGDAAVARRRMLVEYRAARGRASALLAERLDRLRAAAAPRGDDPEPDAAAGSDGSGVGGDEPDPAALGGDPGPVQFPPD